ncbi:MAG: M15 family metallopeptidase [Gammaproteobacteria bacterium]|nr:M15 family metallopeptidase [Gammaproteobacteria bacterium]
MNNHTDAHILFIKRKLTHLGIPETHLLFKALPLQSEPENLVSIGRDCVGQIQRMEPLAAEAWQEMRKAASGNNITLNPISGFRSIAEQTAIIERKLSRGMPINDILKVIAPPGYSEHHTGQAIDISDGDNDDLTERFAESVSFKWLMKNASLFNFTLSYPKNNSTGIAFEPWHWRFKE